MIGGITMGNLETRFVNKENKLINSTTNKMVIISWGGGEGITF